MSKWNICISSLLGITIFTAVREPLILRTCVRLAKACTCRFSQTSRQLRSEATALNRPMSLGPSRDTTGVASDLLFFLAADGQAPHYVTSFDRLAAWVDNSLDQYRVSLCIFYQNDEPCRWLQLATKQCTSQDNAKLQVHLITAVSLNCLVSIRMPNLSSWAIQPSM